MIRKKITALVGLAIVAHVSILLFLQHDTYAVQTIPYKMNFQGRLADNAGAPKPSGTYNMRFRIYDAATNGTVQWSEERAVSSSRSFMVA